MPQQSSQTLQPVVLVVENHEDSRSMLKLILETRGYLVIEATDGEQALLAIENRKPDLILMEVTLPQIDGLTLLRQLRQLRSLADVPIIFLSSRAEPSIKSIALSSGGNEFLVKPLDLGHLGKTLDKYINENHDEYSQG